MNRQTILGAILLAQLIVVAVVWGLQSRPGDAPPVFLSFDASSVDTLTVADAERTVTVARSDGEWQLSNGSPGGSPGGLPADAGKIEGVLEKLSDAAAGWPVATSESAMERFEVVEETHQRHVVISAGDETLADVYLGTSPTFGKVHARHAAGGPVYAIAFSNYEAGARQSDWLDKSLLQPEGTVQSVTRASADGEWTLTSTDTGWTTDGVELDQGETDTFVDRLRRLNVLDLVDAELPLEPSTRLTVVDDAGAHELKLFTLPDDDYAATSNRFEGVFGISSYIAEQLNVSLEDLAADGANGENAERSAESSISAAENDS
jgi:hypothetical protein